MKNSELTEKDFKGEAVLPSRPLNCSAADADAERNTLKNLCDWLDVNAVRDEFVSEHTTSERKIEICQLFLNR